MTIRLLLAFPLLFGLTACHSFERLTAKSPIEMSGSPKSSVTISTTAKSIADLPVCDSSAQGVSAFIQPSHAFVKCDGYQWRGANPGGFEDRFVARETVRFYEWQDSKSKTRWSSPSATTLTPESAEKSCSKGWKLPTAEELRRASLNGLVDGLKAHGGRAFAHAWTADFADANRLALSLSDKALNRTLKVAGVYCLRFSETI